MRLSLQMTGIENIQHELGEIVDTGKINKTLEQSALLVRGEAMLYCPIMTGRLQKSITSRRVNDLTWEVAATADYADYVEFGTYRMYAGTPDNPYIYTSTIGKYPSYRPFLRSALYDCGDRIIALFEKALHEKQ